MQQEQTNTNCVNLVGRIASECTFSHEVFGESFYNFMLEVPRLSENTDTLPVTLSDRLMDRSKLQLGTLVCLNGQIRSYNSYVEAEGRNKLVLTVFVRDIYISDEEPDQNPNEVFLSAYVCKPPNYRTTPFGREIADLLLAANRSYNKSDYIPCIAWGRNARFASRLIVGDSIKVWGRMQSRLYQKKTEDGEIKEKVAYEISISKLEYEGEKEE